jgi:hypothetical protein
MRYRIIAHAVLLCVLRNTDGVAKNAAEIELLKRIAKELEVKSNEEETKISD